MRSTIEESEPKKDIETAIAVLELRSTIEESEPCPVAFVAALRVRPLRSTIEESEQVEFDKEEIPVCVEIDHRGI